MNKDIQLAVRITPDFNLKLQLIASAQGIKKAAWIRQAMENEYAKATKSA